MLKAPVKAARHVYYNEHPVEFRRLNLDVKWYVRTTELFSYLRDHPDMRGVSKAFDAPAKPKSLYSELSDIVHGHRVVHLESRRALNELTFSVRDFAAVARHVSRCAEAANFILYTYHSEHANRFRAEGQAAILSTMPANGRRVIADCLSLRAR